MSAATFGNCAVRTSGLPSSTSAGVDARPFGAGAEEPALAADHARGVKGVPRNQQLDTVAGPQIRADDNVLALAAQQQHLDRVAQVIVIELVVADAMQPHRRLRRHHEVQRRAQRAAVGERRRQSAGRNRLRRAIGLAHEAAGGVRLEISSLRTSSEVMSLIIPPVLPAISAASALIAAGICAPSKAPPSHAAFRRKLRRSSLPMLSCCRT